MNLERDLLRTLYANQWRSSGIDAILCPVNPSVASAHDESTYWGYTSAFNALDLPGTVFPVGTVSANDTWESEPPILGSKDKEYREYYYRDGPAKYRDAPVSLQLVGKRLREETLLCITELVERSLTEAKARKIAD